MTSLSTPASENISYNWLEAGYGFNGSSLHPSHTFSLSGSFSLTNRFYVLANSQIIREKYKSSYTDHAFSNNFHSASLGFHQQLSPKTDFYLEAGIEYSRIKHKRYDEMTSDFRPSTLSDAYELITLGTRTAFSDKFELITKVGYAKRKYPNYSFNENKSGINFGVSGLYKFTDKFSIKLDLSTIGASIGWRISW